jgi:glycosyltransferase involved in cell wall biosynthesis
MKVLFLFGGLPHYYNAILNRLNEVKNLDIVVAVPENKSEVIGKGVKQTNKGITFKLIYTNESTAYYGKKKINKLKEIIHNELPDVIVSIWPYILQFLFNPLLLRTTRRSSIKIINKDIPFLTPVFWDGLRFKKRKRRDENLAFDYKNKFDMVTPFLTVLKRFYLNIADAHVCYVENAKEIFRSYGVKEEKIFITYNSPDTESLFSAKAEAEQFLDLIPQNSFRIIHIGRLVKWKKVHLLIEAVNILKRKYSNIELLIIGSGPEEKQLQTQVSELGLLNNIKFIGSVYDPVILGKYLLQSAVYVLAGMGGLSINEAMAFGKPVICSICDGTERKIVRDGYNGFYFIEDDVIDLSKKIEMIISNPEIVKKMGENSLSIIKNEINVHTVIKGYLNAFNYVSHNNKKLEYFS